MRLFTLSSALRRVALGTALAIAALAATSTAQGAAGFGCGGQHQNGIFTFGYCISTDANGVHVGGVRLAGGGPGQGGYFGHAELSYGGYSWQPGAKHLANSSNDLLMPGQTASTKPVAYWLPGVYCVTWWHANIWVTPTQYSAEPGYCRVVR